MMNREKKLLLILAFNVTLMVLEIVGGIISEALPSSAMPGTC